MAESGTEIWQLFLQFMEVQSQWYKGNTESFGYETEDPGKRDLCNKIRIELLVLQEKKKKKEAKSAIVDYFSHFPAVNCLNVSECVNVHLIWLFY